MKQSLPWEFNGLSASQETPRIYGTRRLITALTRAPDKTLHTKIFGVVAVSFSQGTSWNLLKDLAPFRISVSDPEKAFVIPPPHTISVHYSWRINNYSCASAGNPDTTPADPHPNSNTQQTKNETANVVVQQYSHILLKMGILMPETCWVSKK